MKTFQIEKKHEKKNMKHMPSYIYMPGVCFAFLQNCK